MNLLKFPCQFTTPVLYQARLVAIENHKRGVNKEEKKKIGKSKDTAGSVLTIQKKKKKMEIKDTVQFKNKSCTFLYLFLSLKMSELCTGGLNAI